MTTTARLRLASRLLDICAATSPPRDFHDMQLTGMLVAAHEATCPRDRRPV